MTYRNEHTISFNLSIVTLFFIIAIYSREYYLLYFSAPFIITLIFHLKKTIAIQNGKLILKTLFKKKHSNIADIEKVEINIKKNFEGKRTFQMTVSAKKETIQYSFEFLEQHIPSLLRELQKENEYISFNDLAIQLKS